MKRTIANFAVAIAVCWTGLSAHGFADDTLLSAFGQGGSACYSRNYDQAHLASHPDQLVRSISVEATWENDPEWDMILRLDVELRGDADRYSGVAYCRDAGAATVCLIEGDGGNFTLSMNGQRLRLSVGDFFMLEGAHGFTPDFARVGDDRVFLLDAAKTSACS